MRLPCSLVLNDDDKRSLYFFVLNIRKINWIKQQAAVGIALETSKTDVYCLRNEHTRYQFRDHFAAQIQPNSLFSLFACPVMSFQAGVGTALSAVAQRPLLNRIPDSLSNAVRLNCSVCHLQSTEVTLPARRICMHTHWLHLP